MKLLTPVELSKTVKGDYRIISVAGNFSVARIKDVNMYYMKLERQSNDYLKQLLKISSEMEFIMSDSLVSIKSQEIREITISKTAFYERLKYLTFYDYVVALFKMNALCSMTDSLIEVAKFVSVKHTNQLKAMKYDFFVARQYFTKVENTMKIQLVPDNIKKLNKAI